MSPSPKRKKTRSEMLAAVRGVLGSRIWKSLPPRVYPVISNMVLNWDFKFHNIYRIHATHSPDKAALICRRRRLSWSALDRRIEALACGLRSAGIRSRDKVAVVLHNCCEYIETVGAIDRAGAAPVPLSYRLTANEYRYLLENSEAAAVVFQDTCREPVREALTESLRESESRRIAVGEPTSDETAYEDLIARHEGKKAKRVRVSSPTIIYTSGTTGRPKGAMRDSAKTGPFDSLMLLSRLPLRHEDRVLFPSPLYHILGGGFSMLAQFIGATVVLMDHFDAAEALEIIEEEEITALFAVPMMVDMLVDAAEADPKPGGRMKSLRILLSSGSALTTRTCEAVRRVFGGHFLYDLYGSTETGSVTLATPEDMIRRPGTIGRAVPGTDIVLLGEDRKPVPEGEVGELYARNAFTRFSYYKDEAATKKGRWNSYFSAGDLARRDEDGYLHIAGRRSNMIVSGGMNIYPAEIEAELVKHPKIREVSVIGVPDEKWGETVKAFIVLEPGEEMEEPEVIAFSRERLAGFKTPRRIAFLKELPKNMTGKVLERDLRELP